MKKIKFLAFFPCLLIFISSCDESKKSSNNTNSNNVNNTNNPNCLTPGGDASDFRVLPGRFFLEWSDSFTVLQGRVWGGDVPDPFTETRREGVCRLLESTPSFCDPACEWGTQVCIGGTCANYPMRLDAGMLTVTGAAASLVVSVRADATGEYAWYQGAPPAESRVSLKTSGGDVGPIELETCVPPAFDVTGDWGRRLEERQPGQDVKLTWSNPAPGARVYLRMTTGVATHGGVSHAEIECEGPDTGQLVLPGAFLDRLYETGWSCGECGVNTLYRYFAARTNAGSREIEWRIATSTHFYYIPR